VKKQRKSRNALAGAIAHVCKGVAVYKVNASRFYRVKVWLPAERRYFVKSTKAQTRVEAIAVAEELRSELARRGTLSRLPKERTFEHFADKLILSERLRADRGELNSREWRDTRSILQNKKRGLLLKLGKIDICDAATVQKYTEFMDWLAHTHPHLAATTRNRTAVVFRKVLKVAAAEGTIQAVPETPRAKAHDNPRAFFRFVPVVERTEDDEYKLLLRTAAQMAKENASVPRAIPITDELRDMILFLAHSSLRPTEGELFSLRYSQVAVARLAPKDPPYLNITVPEGKTGHRVTVTMRGAVAPISRAKLRNPSWAPDSYVFFPSYANRATAKKIAQRQFRAVLERAGLELDKVTGAKRSLYSLRHTAICMRLVLSEGEVNHVWLAENCGTSVQQIERFYAKDLPLTPQKVRNLQSFGPRHRAHQGTNAN
jgi:hypothetical protein